MFFKNLKYVSKKLDSILKFIFTKVVKKQIENISKFFEYFPFLNIEIIPQRYFKIFTSKPVSSRSDIVDTSRYIWDELL